MTQQQTGWTIERKHEFGNAIFMDDLVDEVRRKGKARLQEITRRCGFTEVEALLFVREVIYEVASNLVNMAEKELRDKGVEIKPLFPQKEKSQA